MITLTVQPGEEYSAVLQWPMDNLETIDPVSGEISGSELDFAAMGYQADALLNVESSTSYSVKFSIVNQKTGAAATINDGAVIAQDVYMLRHPTLDANGKCTMTYLSILAPVARGVYDVTATCQAQGGMNRTQRKWILRVV